MENKVKNEPEERSRLVQTKILLFKMTGKFRQELTIQTDHSDATLLTDGF